MCGTYFIKNRFRCMKRSLSILALCFGLLSARAQEATLPNPDAKALGMGGVTMTTLSTAHALYDNAAMAAFSRDQMLFSSSWYGQGDYDAYAVTAARRIGTDNMLQLGWRQYLRERGNNDMSVDAGYSRRIGERWAVGIVGRYTRLERPDDSVDALAADLCAAWSMPLELGSRYATLRAGAKLANLGGYLSATDYTLPVNFTAGAALDTYLSDAHQITVGADAGYYFNPSAVRGFQLSAGAEYNLMQLIQLRAGYHWGERRDYYPDYATVGAGVRFLHLRLDFAYLFAARNTVLRNTYSVSFGLDF